MISVKSLRTIHLYKRLLSAIDVHTCMNVYKSDTDHKIINLDKKIEVNIVIQGYMIFEIPDI